MSCDCHELHADCPFCRTIVADRPTIAATAPTIAAESPHGLDRGTTPPPTGDTGPSLLIAKPGTQHAHLLQMCVAAEAEKCVLWPYRTRTGYGLLDIDGKTRSAHIIACIYANGPRPEGKEAAHSCGVKACVNPFHLRWASHAENCEDRVQHGTLRMGEEHAAAKLTADDVTAMRQLVASGEASMAQLARRYGVHFTTVEHAVKGKTWKSVPAPHIPAPTAGATDPDTAHQAAGWALKASKENAA